MNNNEKILDNLFGTKDVSYKAAINNENWWWNQIKELDHIDKRRFNSCSYGNLAMAVYYGGDFPERSESIQRLKSICLRDL
jgi:hypothetical protein